MHTHMQAHMHYNCGVYSHKFPREKLSLQEGNATPVFMWCWGHDMGWGVLFSEMEVKGIWKLIILDHISRLLILVINSRAQGCY